MLVFMILDIHKVTYKTKKYLDTTYWLLQNFLSCCHNMLKFSEK